VNWEKVGSYVQIAIFGAAALGFAYLCGLSATLNRPVPSQPTPPPPVTVEQPAKKAPASVPSQSGYGRVPAEKLEQTYEADNAPLGRYSTILGYCVDANGRAYLSHFWGTFRPSEYGNVERRADGWYFYPSRFGEIIQKACPFSDDTPMRVVTGGAQ
jgi:hypothetical protein